MRSDIAFRVWTVILCALPWFAVAAANAQSSGKAPEITVYESPT